MYIFSNWIRNNINVWQDLIVWISPWVLIPSTGVTQPMPWLWWWLFTHCKQQSNLFDSHTLNPNDQVAQRSCNLMSIFSLLFLGVVTLKYPYPRGIAESSTYEKERVHSEWGKNQSSSVENKADDIVQSVSTQLFFYCNCNWAISRVLIGLVQTMEMTW